MKNSALNMPEIIRAARHDSRPSGTWFPKSLEAEGGCGVTGFACSIPLSGRHIYEPSIQMRNRGNGKGGGVAACGLMPEDLNVSRKVLDEDYILQVALLDPTAKADVEKECIEPYFNIDQAYMVPTVDDYRDVPLLEVKPPDIARYFVRVKPGVLTRFAEEKGLESLPEREVEDEFVYQNSIRLNQRFYASLGEKRAFAMSHCRNLIIAKIVGFAEAAVQYYCMQDTSAHVWIAHQRYPTKGRVWHPGGAHPFVGMNEALVHNGDFANYHSVTEYLAGRNIFPQFVTDTEVSVLLFDLWNRIYKYPLEYIIEALAPTSELDIERLAIEKQQLYQQIQAAHIHASPDGPWFFIIARSLAESREFQLLGITDTAMLRPQVFALQEGRGVSIGLVCSEKQAIDATLAGLAAEDPRFMPVADQYWNARGGSSTDGGAFMMTVSPNGNEGRYTLKVTDKFNNRVSTPSGQTPCDLSIPASATTEADEDRAAIEQAISDDDPQKLFEYLRDRSAGMSYDRLRTFVDNLVELAAQDAPGMAIDTFTLAIDRRYPTGSKKRSSILTILRNGLERIFDEQPLCTQHNEQTHARITWDTRSNLRSPDSTETTLLIDARGFSPEGDACDAVVALRAYELGWQHLIHYNSRGTRFHGVGFGPNTNGLRIDCYDNPGDYLASGIDGLEIYVHGNAQDQLCQIAKRGKLVVYGDIGQTFLYGGKGGDFFIQGNAAGRPVINTVGRPKVVINGTALDYLAESFMAGNPHDGGGFVVVNGVRFDENGNVVPLEMPYPGGNLLSLASGGAVYMRDPFHLLVDDLLNGGVYRALTNADWKLILPYLQENERLFGIQIERDLLTVDGVLREPREVYRKVIPHKNAEIEAELEGLGD